jgi:hypothetical protein
MREREKVGEGTNFSHLQSQQQASRRLDTEAFHFVKELKNKNGKK